MAARGRPRAGAKDEIATHEERDLWGKIVTDLKDLTRQSKRASELVSSIKTLEYRDDDQGGMCVECGGGAGAAAGGGVAEAPSSWVYVWLKLIHV